MSTFLGSGCQCQFSSPRLVSLTHKQQSCNGAPKAALGEVKILAMAVGALQLTSSWTFSLLSLDAHAKLASNQVVLTFHM